MKKNLCCVWLWLVITTLMSSIPVATASTATEYQEVEWTALIPEDDLNALLNPPDYLAQIEDGSSQDSVESFEQKDVEDERARRFQEALSSMRVVEAFDQQAIRIPGFIVPLQAGDERNVTEFFIVPYFGACLHMPPPPPNQIIYATLEEGIAVDSLYTPFWFEGTLSIGKVENGMGTSAYKLSLDNVTPYEE